MDICVLFGEKIKQLRMKNGWSQEDLADFSGLHRTYISGIERGLRNPTLCILERLAQCFNLTISELLSF